jgi:hypothetical protein
MDIQLFNKKFYPEIKEWWIKQGEIEPSLSMLPEDTTFLFFKDGKPIISICLYLTNCKEVCYLSNFIANPLYREKDRKDLVKEALTFIEIFAKHSGYKRILCFGYKEKVKKRFQDLGLDKRLDNISSFVKDL